MSSTERPWTALYPDSVRALTGVPATTLGDMLEGARERYGSRTAVSFQGSTLTFTELHARAHAFARLLTADGLAAGERVAIVLPNRPEYIIAVFGTVLAGGIAVQVNVRYPAEEMRRILDDSGADIVLTTDEAIRRCSPDEEGFLGRRVYRVDTEAGAHSTVGTPFSALERHLGEGPLEGAATPSDVAILQYTGGTTGAAKGVMLTHRNLIANLEQRYAMTYGLLDVPAGAKSVNVLPMCHVYGMTTITLLGVRAGMNQLVVSEFRAAEMLELIRRERPYVFTGVPTMYMALNREPALADSGLGEVAIFNSAGAGFPQELMDQFERKTGGKLIEGFGISEASPSTHLNPVLFAERRPGSIGIPIPLTDVRVVDQGGRSLEGLPAGEVGEMVVRGPQVMAGYWNKPELTAAALQDGWLRTGDLARMDAEGYFYIVGRMKDMIVTSGFNVYPAEVEQVLARVPGVIEVAVVGMKDDYRGEAIAAYLALEPGAAVTDAELDAHCRTHLAGYKVPRAYYRIDELPKTPVGKIAKNRLATDPAATRRAQ